MKPTYYLFIACFFIFGLNQTIAQENPKIDTLYYNEGNVLCFKEDAASYRVRTHGQPIAFKEYDAATQQLQFEGSYKDLQGTKKTGMFKGYHKNGQLKYSVSYEDNTPEGAYLSYFSNGQKQLEGNYFQGNKKGTWKEYDSTGFLYAVDNFTKGNFTGESITYYPNGFIKRKETYLDGKLEVGKCFTLAGNDTTYFPRFENPKFPGGEEELYKYLGKTIKYPPIARELGIQGKVILQFIVDKEGNLQELKVLNNPNQSLTDEALRVVKLMPAWTPGRSEGELVKVSFKLPVKFQLN